jgi:hypothetical protein
LRFFPVQRISTESILLGGLRLHKNDGSLN